MHRFVRRLPLALTIIVGLSVASAGFAATPKTSKPKAAASSTASLTPVPSPEQILKGLKVAHPRLLVDEARLEDLRHRTASDATLKEWDRQVRRQADKLLTAPLPRHVLPDGLRLLSTSRATLDRVYTLTLMYRLHGDRRYLERLWQELETVAAFPDWNPKHFLDTAEMTHAVAIAYDWLYETWTPVQRATLRKAIVELGLKPSLDIYRKHRWWAAATHNWNQVCNGGMTVGALAIAEEEPQLAGEILHAALASVPLAMQSYAPDGAGRRAGLLGLRHGIQRPHARRPRIGAGHGFRAGEDARLLHDGPVSALYDRTDRPGIQL